MSSMSRRKRNQKRIEQTDSEMVASMNKQKPAKWIDPRTPVSVTQVGKWTVTIYDQAAYEASFREYPDDPNEKPMAKANNALSQFKKSKPQARYNWTMPININNEHGDVSPTSPGRILGKSQS